MTEPKDPPAAKPADRSPEDANPRRGVAVGEPYRELGTFSAGALVIERFRILRYIARGGSGEVYEAFDTELRCPVALKVVRPELTANKAVMERFRREIALARQVTHPNVCRIFDVFKDEHRAGDQRHENLFLTMELLVGESLAERIRDKGPLSTAEALPLIEDMIAGLEAAHRAGVIHRDFKSANVVLAREGERPRAVITDFGLAQVTDPDDPAPLTQTGTVVGTPNYMAPEQITGDVVTPAVDQYALGIVIYEMLTGLRPFRGSNDLSTAVKRLTEPAPSPRLLLPELEARWEHAVLRCLERNPKDRFPAIDDVRDAITGAVEIGPPPSRRNKTRRGFLVGAAAVLVLALAAGFRLSSALESGVADEPSRAQLAAGPSLAVFDFENLAAQPQAEWLSTALPEMINMELAVAGDVVPIPSAEVDRVATGLGLGGARDFDQQAILAIRQRLGASHVVEGSYLSRPEQDGVRLHLRIYSDGQQGRIVVMGRESQLAEVVREASSRLRAELGLESANVDISSGVGELAMLEVGREELRKRSFQGARQIFQQLVDQDSDSAMAQALLAKALHSLGDPAAEAQAERALESARDLPRAQQLEIEGHAAFLQRRFDAAAETFGSLARFYPQNRDYLAAWAESLIAAGEWQRALDVLGIEQVESFESQGKAQRTGSTSELRELLLTARAAGSGRRFELQLDAAKIATDEARGRGAVAAAAEAELEHARALTGLRQLETAADLAESAERNFRSQNLIGGVLDSLEQRARIADLLGQLDIAESLRAEADEIAEAQRRS